MSTVIGLYPANQEVSQEIERLKYAGFVRDNIRVLNNDGAIKKLLGCDPYHILGKYASWGTLFGIVVYGVLILSAILFDSNFYPIGQTIGFEIILVGILFCALMGGIIGAIKGLAQYQEDTYLYTQRINIDDNLFILQTPREDEEKAVKALCQIGCRDVRVVSEKNESI